MADGSFTDVPVVIGMQSGTNIQITADQIKEGDEVQLTQMTSVMSDNRLRFGTFGVVGGPGGPGGPGGGRQNGGGGGGGRRPPQ